MAKKLARKPAPEEEPDEQQEDHTEEWIAWTASSNVEPLLYNTDDACHMLGKISKPMIYRLISTGKLKPVKVGSRSMFTKAELQRYIKECEEAPPQAG